MKNKQHEPLRFPPNREKLIAHALESDDGCISVGGLASRLGMFLAPEEPSSADDLSGCNPTGLGALGRLVQLARREQGLEPEAFANKLGLDLKELLDIESGYVTPELRVLYLVSTGLRVSYDKLQVLVGYRVSRDQSLERQTLRFAASSGPMDKLTRTEAQALHDFIQALHE